MKKSTKVLLGVATIWPVLYICFFMASIFALVIFGALRGGPPGPGSILLPLGFMGLMFVHMITIFGSLALTAFYIIKVIKMKSLNENMKIMWVLLLYFAAMLAEPVFWYLYIWRETPESALPNQSAQLGPGLGSTWSTQTAAPEAETTYVPPPKAPDWR